MIARRTAGVPMTNRKVLGIAFLLGAAEQSFWSRYPWHGIGAAANVFHVIIGGLGAILLVYVWRGMRAALRILSQGQTAERKKLHGALRRPESATCINLQASGLTLITQF